MALLVGPIVDLAKKFGPKLGPAVLALVAFLAKNPKLSKWLKDHLKTILQQLVEVLKLRGDAAKSRKIIDSVRTAVGRMKLRNGTVLDAQAESWLGRTNEIEIAVDLAEDLSEPTRKKTLAQCKAKAESLMAEIIASSMRS